jgi:hypothetical protein
MYASGITNPDDIASPGRGVSLMTPLGLVCLRCNGYHSRRVLRRPLSLYLLLPLYKRYM